ncbi:MAG: hypothetical protein M1826_000095 [Phylliscum demangeonii]|nr:MAG: hypothetical protein M1826_000095 [Phylliscum demangeonii]
MAATQSAPSHYFYRRYDDGGLALLRHGATVHRTPSTDWIVAEQKQPQQQEEQHQHQHQYQYQQYQHQQHQQQQQHRKQLELQLQAQPPSHLQPHYLRYPQDPHGLHEQQYVPALNIIDFDLHSTPSPPSLRRPSASSGHGHSVSSLSSWSSQERRRPRSPSDSGRLEKSAFRTFVDSKSDALRSKLSFRSASSSALYAPRPRDRLSPIPVPVHQRAASWTGDGGIASLRPPSDEATLNFGEHLSSVKRWAGGGKMPQPWSKLRKDPELWDPTGDTLVYLGHELHGTGRPNASLRIHSSVLLETGSAFFLTILREGAVDTVDYALPPTPVSPSRSPAITRSPDRGRPPTPPRSQESLPEAEPAVRYELFFPAPGEATKLEQLRHHLTTRNVFGLLFLKPLVGLNLYQALLDLHERLQMYLPAAADSAGLMIDAVVALGLDDIRNDPGSAAGLLAWSEGPGVRWREGWREGFVHCSGMYGRVKFAPELRDVSHATRVLLDRASLEIHVRVQQAADRLATFDFADLWPTQSAAMPPARQSFDRFRRFLIKHYAAVFWAWPPLPRFGTADIWLTRDVVVRLQRDCGALYDYLVDRDLTWDAAADEPLSSAAAARPRGTIVSKGRRPHHRVDGDGLPTTDMLLGFDHRHRFPHIPHPYPLLPPSHPPARPAKASRRFGTRRPAPAPAADGRFAERRLALDYAEASNIFVLGAAVGGNELVEAFARFERTDQLADVDPIHARRGRWLLLYAVLQVLATVSVDTPGLRYRRDVRYFLNPRLRGTPPWTETAEACHHDAYCWRVPATWTDPDHVVARSALALPNHREILIGPGGIGDGSGRGRARPVSVDSTLAGLAPALTTATPLARELLAVERTSSPVAADRHPAAAVSRSPSDWPIKTGPLLHSAPRGRDLAPGQSTFVPPDDW